MSRYGIPIVVLSIVALCGVAVAQRPGASDGGDGSGSPSIDKQLQALEKEVSEATSDHAAASESAAKGADAAQQGRGGTAEPGGEASASGGEVSASGGEASGSAAPAGGGLTTNWELFRDPVLCALFAGAVLGLLGVYVIARRIVFVSAALSEVAALGITLGFFIVGYGGLAGTAHDLLPPLVAILLCLLVVWVLSWIGERESFPRDAVLGVAFVVPMALVLLLGPYIPQEMHEIEAVLHGSAVMVRKSDLYAVAIAGALVVAVQLLAFRGFVFASLDPLVARTQGVPVRALDAVLFGSIALMTGLVTRALGALPTFALTVLPAVGAIRMQIGLAWVFVLASVAGALSGAGGYLVAFWMDWSVGASQTMVAAGVCLVLRVAGAALAHLRSDPVPSGAVA